MPRKVSIDDAQQRHRIAELESQLQGCKCGAQYNAEFVDRGQSFQHGEVVYKVLSCERA